MNETGKPPTTGSPAGSVGDGRRPWVNVRALGVLAIIAGAGLALCGAGAFMASRGHAGAKGVAAVVLLVALALLLRSSWRSDRS